MQPHLIYLIPDFNITLKHDQCYSQKTCIPSEKKAARNELLLQVINSHHFCCIFAFSVWEYVAKIDL